MQTQWYLWKTKYLLFYSQNMAACTFCPCSRNPQLWSNAMWIKVPVCFRKNGQGKEKHLRLTWECHNLGRNLFYRFPYNCKFSLVLSLILCLLTTDLCWMVRNHELLKRCMRPMSQSKREPKDLWVGWIIWHNWSQEYRIDAAGSGSASRWCGSIWLGKWKRWGIHYQEKDKLISLML